MYNLSKSIVVKIVGRATGGQYSSSAASWDGKYHANNSERDSIYT